MFMNNGDDIFLMISIVMLYSEARFKMLLTVSYQQNKERLNFIDK
jgi:hypothetical protein